MTHERATDQRFGRAVDWLPWLLVGLAIVVVLVGGWIRRYSIDDAFINYRIVHQIEAGNGPVFNAGERVEAFTSPAWLALLWGLDEVLPFRIEWIGMVGGIMLGALGVLFAAFGSHRLHRLENASAERVVLVPLGALAIAVFPPTYRLIAMGLENGLSLFWLGACAWALCRWASDERRLGLPGAMLLGSGVLVRPDLVPFTVLFLVAVLVGDRSISWWRRVWLLGAATALPVAVQIFRMGYYGEILPNTAIAKSAGLSNWGQGWDYLMMTVRPYFLWLPVAILLIVGYVPLFRAIRAPDGHRSCAVRRQAMVAGAFLAASVLCALYVVRVGGDYIPARLLLPAIFGFMAPIMFVRMPRFADVRTLSLLGAATIWIVVIGAFIRTDDDGHPTRISSPNGVTISAYRSFLAVTLPPDPRPGRVYDNAREIAVAGSRERSAVVVSYGIGKLGFAADNDLYVFDQLGLALPLGAHLALRERGFPGHEKTVPRPWIAALVTKPGSLVSPSDFPQVHRFYSQRFGVVESPDQSDARGRPFAERVATARAVLGCRRMQDFRSSFTSPMSFRLFIANVVHARSYTNLEIPGEPADALKALCGVHEQAVIVGHHGADSAGEP